MPIKFCLFGWLVKFVCFFVFDFLHSLYIICTCDTWWTKLQLTIESGESPQTYLAFKTISLDNGEHDHHSKSSRRGTKAASQC